MYTDLSSLIANHLRVTTDWDKLESHNKFKETSDYPVMHKHFGAVVEGPASMLHAELTPAAKQRAVFSAPCTEIVRFYRTSESEAYVSSVNEFAEHATKQADGWMGSVGGWAVEDVEHAKFGGDGKTTGKVYWLAIAWQSYEAHMAFRDTEEFKKILPLLTSDKDVVDIDMCHIALRPY